MNDGNNCEEVLPRSYFARLNCQYEHSNCLILQGMIFRCNWQRLWICICFLALGTTLGWKGIPISLCKIWRVCRIVRVYSQYFPVLMIIRVLHFGNAFASFILPKFQGSYPEIIWNHCLLFACMFNSCLFIPIPCADRFWSAWSTSCQRPFAPLKSGAAKLKRHRCRARLGAGVWMCHQNPRPAVGYQHDWPEGPRFLGFGRRIEDVHMARVAFNAYSHIFTKDVSNIFQSFRLITLVLS